GMHNYETREQQLAIKSMQFDLAIHLLEKSLENGHERVRGEIAKILGYPKTKGVAISFHKSLLALAKNKDNQYRLITTNFDRIFEKIRKRKEYQANAYIAPNLPLVDDKWNGIVYLHGLINESLEGAGQDTLIVSSGDFGLAYLIDRWASRFMEKVFLNYSVCFIGYKLGDPLIRYMTDAITAIRSKKGTIPEVFAFCPYSGSKIDSTQQTWESKGLTPIMYNQKFKHYLLRETLKAWSASYRLGLQGRASIVQSLSRMKLRSNTISNDKICQMIWALCDPTGHASRRFAETTPTFDLGWLTAFAEKEYDSDSLELFGISHNNRKSEHKVHTLLSRPPSDIHQLPVLSLVNNTMHNEIELDVSMTNISTWLTYHLNNPTLLLWIQKQGGVLHPTFRRKISNRLREIVILERNNNIENKRKLNELKAKGSDTIPNSQMRMLWELMISGRFHLPHIEPGFLIALYQNNEENELMLTSSDIILRVLTPAIRIREIFPFTNQIHDYSNSEEERKKLETIVVLNAQTNLILNATERSERFKESLAEIALELTLKLKEASELYEIASKLNELPFRSMLSIPNLDDIQVYHSDKYAFRSLTRLVLDSWKTLHAKDPELAFSVLNLWQSLRFPIFKRLFFYGLAVVDQFNVSLLINVFRQDEGQWLWSEETQFEVLQILKKVAKYCRTAEVKQITDLLLSSIPYRKHEDCNSLLSPSDIPAQEYALWMRLAVMNSINEYLLDRAPV
ncbi:MAG: SIR2 family protein, partial [Sphaerochaetaceae bacterium]|nr:SIR2 family protein [Sphaerochaetaceae bacterium]